MCKRKFKKRESYNNKINEIVFSGHNYETYDILNCLCLSPKLLFAKLLYLNLKFQQHCQLDKSDEHCVKIRKFSILHIPFCGRLWKPKPAWHLLPTSFYPLSENMGVTEKIWSGSPPPFISPRHCFHNPQK